MNKACLVGRLTKDPMIRYTDSQEPLCIARFTLAVDRRRKRDDGQNADFISCLAFGKIAEHIEKYYHKGMKTVISGRIQTGSYDHRDGYKVYTTDVVIEEMEFAESKKASDAYQQQQAGYQQNYGYQEQRTGYQQGYGYQQQNNGYSPQNQMQSWEQTSIDDELPPGFQVIDEDDVPF